MTKSSRSVILITGATSGIGRATALLLAQSGTTIFAVGRNQRNLAKLQKEITSLRGVCETYRRNLESHAEIKGLFSDIIKTHKVIQWIVQSAGYLDHAASVMPEDSNSLRKMFAVNTFALIDIARFFLPHMQKGGFIHISSTAGIWGNAEYPIYSASKGAVNTYGRALAKECVRKKLSCITLCPGATNTPMMLPGTKKYQEPEAVARVIQKITVGKSRYKNGDIVIIRDGKSILYQRL